MNQRYYGSLRVLMLLIIANSVGCCCIQGVDGCGSVAYGPRDCAPCGAGPLARLASCRGACGDVYIDEWVSEPPVMDNCGFDCGGCGMCQRCQPVRNLLRLLWGTAYRASCCLDACGGCASCSATTAGGYSKVAAGGTGCNCGQIHPAGPYMTPQPIPMSPAESPRALSPPSAVPTPAPEIESTTGRLNPAVQRRTVSRASAYR